MTLETKEVYNQLEYKMNCHCQSRDEGRRCTRFGAGTQVKNVGNGRQMRQLWRKGSYKTNMQRTEGEWWTLSVKILCKIVILTMLFEYQCQFQHLFL